jgi:hypothetical protein
VSGSGYVLTHSFVVMFNQAPRYTLLVKQSYIIRIGIRNEMYFNPFPGKADREHKAVLKILSFHLRY